MKKWIPKGLIRIWDAWRYRHEPEQLRVLANIYWRAILLVAAVIFVSIASYGGSKLLEVLNGGKDSSALLLSGGGGPLLLNPKDLQETVDNLEARRTQYEFLAKNPPRIADPSR